MTIQKTQNTGRILFLGLDGAGKTALINELQRQMAIPSFNNPVSENQRRSSTPIQISQDKRNSSPGQNNDRSLSSSGNLGVFRNRTSLTKDAIVPPTTTNPQMYPLDIDRFVHLVDLPGRRALRSMWTTALLGEQLTNPPPSSTSSNVAAMAPHIVGIVFVIDASDTTCFPLVAKELVHLQRVRDHAPHLRKVPVILILNKIDHWGETTSSDKRKASRVVRQELKKCLEYQLLVDVKRFPRAYTHFSVTETNPSSSTSKTISTLISSNSNNTNSATTAATIQQRKANVNEAMSNCTLTMMTSIMECCAQDPDHIRMLHLWLKEEVSKV